MPKLIKKSRGYNIRDFTLAFDNADNNKKGLYCGYMDGNSDLMGVARPNLQTYPGGGMALQCNGYSIEE
jgi:hypothetical protein